MYKYAGLCVTPTHIGESVKIAMYFPSASSLAYRATCVIKSTTIRQKKWIVGIYIEEINYGSAVCDLGIFHTLRQTTSSTCAHNSPQAHKKTYSVVDLPRHRSPSPTIPVSGRAPASSIPGHGSARSTPHAFVLGLDAPESPQNSTLSAIQPDLQ